MSLVVAILVLYLGIVPTYAQVSYYEVEGVKSFVYGSIESGNGLANPFLVKILLNKILFNTRIFKP